LKQIVHSAHSLKKEKSGKAKAKDMDLFEIGEALENKGHDIHNTPANPAEGGGGSRGAPAGSTSGTRGGNEPRSGTSK